jgi:lipid A 3-O-deacylase
MHWKHQTPLVALNGRGNRGPVQKHLSLAVNAWCLWASTGVALAQAEKVVRALQPPSASVWQNGIGNGFKVRTVQAGFNLGAGFGWAAFGSRVAHDLTLASANMGWIASSLMAEDRWFKGNWEIAGELFGGAQYRPEYRYIVGLTPLLRYNLATGTRWVPFVNGGAGLTATDIGHPDLGSTFQFTSQGGLGTHYFLRDDLAMTVDCRWLHISNAGIRRPNNGVNTQMLYLGMNWFF